MVGEPERPLPDELQQWVDEQAAASDEDAADVLSRAVALYRLVENHATATVEEMPLAEGLDENLDGLSEQVSDLNSRLEAVESDLGEERDELTEHVSDLSSRLEAVEGDPNEDVDELTEHVSDLSSRLEAVEDDFDEKVADVRERVIQVKRETDSKAPASHDHTELREEVDAVVARLNSGFENYEEVLSYLTDETDNLNQKVSRIAQVVRSLRRRTEAVEQQVTRIDVVADLKETANRHGDAKAKCDDCGGSVAIGLLTEPTCPHCESGFVDVEPAGRPFGSARLKTGDPPALMAEAENEPSDDGRSDGVHDGSDGVHDEGESTAEDDQSDESAETVTELFKGSEK